MSRQGRRNRMISLKRFLDHHLTTSASPEHDISEAMRQAGQLLVDGIARNTVRGRETDFKTLRQALHLLTQQIDQPESAMSLLTSAGEVVEALETHHYHTTEYFRERKEQMRSMVLMLTDTLADISG